MTGSLWEMRPRDTMDDFPDGWLLYAITQSEIIYTFAIAMGLAYCYYLIFTQSCIWITRALIIVVSISPFSNFVMCIIGICTNPQMRWIATTWVIATVTNYKTIWNSAISKFINNTSNRCHRTISRNNSITRRSMCASPRPAIIWGASCNARPKTPRQSVRPSAMSIVISHGLPFNISKFRIVSGTDIRLFSTATFAKFYHILHYKLVYKRCQV